MKRILLHSLTVIIYILLMVNLSKPVNIFGFVDMFFLTCMLFAINYVIHIAPKQENSSN